MATALATVALRVDTTLAIPWLSVLRLGLPGLGVVATHREDFLRHVDRVLELRTGR